MNTISRRGVLGVIGAAAGSGAIFGAAKESTGQADEKTQRPDWQYRPLSPADCAAEAYRLKPDGGCMYGAFRAIVAAWLEQTGRPADSFPFHMMCYGEGGIGGWGTVCGALNAGAAVIGLFEKDKKRRQELIGQLFSWYEGAELPGFLPSDAKATATVKSKAESVLCHVSVARWCKVSGAAPLSTAMKERCRRLTADVAAKTVELLNRMPPPLPKEPSAATVAKTTEPPPAAIGKMDCNTCHPKSNDTSQ